MKRTWSNTVFAAFTMAVVAFNAGPRAEADLLVVNSDANSVLRFDASTGAFLGNFVAPGSGGLLFPLGLAYGPDGNLYVCNGDFLAHRNIKRYDGATGEFLGDAAGAPVGLINLHLAFGPDGSLYGYEILNVSVDRFNRATNAYERFTTGASVIGSGGFTFGPDSSLYVCNVDSLQQYDSTTGAYLGDLVTQPGMQLSGPTLGPDGNLYVSDEADNTVKRYEFATGMFTLFASGGGLNMPGYVTFGPDGNLYVASNGTDSILRYNGTTGEFIDTFASGGGMRRPFYMIFAPSQGGER